MVTWSEDKRRINITKHGLDFVGCEAIFDHPVISWEDDREAYSEQRLCLIGWFNGVLLHMTYTERKDDLHVISLRRAEKHEIRRYAQTFS